MKKTLVAFVALLAFGAIGYAVSVNPMSNVLGDSAATANTLVYRDSNGSFTIADNDIVTAELNANSVLTAKLLLDLPVSGIACVTTRKGLGTCSNTGVGVCNCN